MRSLFEQLEAYFRLSAGGSHIDPYVHFSGAIRPPVPGTRPPIGDPVFDAVADYASKVAARAGLLASRPGDDERQRFESYARMTRAIFTVEHALAVDLARTFPERPLRERQRAARASLALAAYWCDRDRLYGMRDPSAHALLGTRPADPVGAVLYQHALDSMSHRDEERRTVATETETIDITLGLGLVKG